MNKITTESVRAKLNHENETERRNVRVHQKIGDVLVKFAGKKLTARVATAVAKATGWTVQVDSSVMLELRVWGGDSGLTVHDPHRFSVCYHNENTGNYDPALFERYDARNGSAALARIAQRQALIANVSLLRAYVAAVSETIAKIEAAAGVLGLDCMPSELRYDAKHLIEEAVKNI